MSDLDVLIAIAVDDSELEKLEAAPDKASSSFQKLAEQISSIGTGDGVTNLIRQIGSLTDDLAAAATRVELLQELLRTVGASDALAGVNFDSSGLAATLDQLRERLQLQDQVNREAQQEIDAQQRLRAAVEQTTTAQKAQADEAAAAAERVQALRDASAEPRPSARTLDQAAAENRTVVTGARLGVAEETGDPLKIAGASAADQAATASLIRKTQAQEAETAATERANQADQIRAQLLDEIAGLDDKAAVAQQALTAATERFNAANAAGAPLEDQRRLLSGQIRAQSNVDQLAAAAGGGGGSGGIGGFLRGFGNGFSANGDGGAEGLGEIAAITAKYTLLYQVVRATEDVIKDSISDYEQFNRAVTDTSQQLEISRDAAAALVNNLGDIAAANGVDPSQGAAFGVSFAQRFAGQGSQTALAQQGATLGSQLQILTGDGQQGLNNASAVVQSFGLSVSDLPRVLDAATSAAQKFGLANANDVLPGLAQIADELKFSGFSVEQGAAIVADVSTKTGQTSQAAAGELQRVLGRSGAATFQGVFSREDISTNQSFADELAELASKYNDLNSSEQRYIDTTLGGGRAVSAASVLLQDYARIQQGAADASDSAGITSREANARLNDVSGLVSKLGADFQNLAKDIGNTGIFDGIGVLAKGLDAALQTTDQLLRLFDEIPGPLKDSLAILAEIAVTLKVIDALQGTGLLSRIPGVGGIGGRAAGGVTAGEAGAALGGVSIAGPGLRGDTDIGAAFRTNVLGIGEALGEGSFGLLGILKSGTSKLGDFFNSGIGALSAAVVGGIAIDQLFKAGFSQNTAKQAGDDLLTTGVDVNDLQGRADALNRAATNTQQSSGGFFGTIENGLGQVFGGEGTGGSARADRALAASLAAQASRQATAQGIANAANPGGVLGPALLDDTGAALTNSLTSLTTEGKSAAEQLALTGQALSNFAAQAKQGATFLDPQQAGKVANDIGDTLANNIAAGFRIDAAAEAFGSTSDFVRGKVSANAASFFQSAQASTSLTDVANNFFASNGLTAGGTVTAAQQGKLVGLEDAQVKALAQQVFGKPFDDLDKQTQADLIAGVRVGVQDILARNNLASGKPLSSTVIQELAASDIKNTTANVATQTQLGQLGATPLGQSAPLNATTQAITFLQNQVKSILSSSPGQDVSNYTNAITSLQVTAQTQAESLAQGNAQLATSKISPLDALGNLTSQVNGLSDQIKATNDPQVLSGLIASRNQLAFQAQTQVVTNANSARTAAVDPRNVTGLDAASLANAQASLANVLAQKGTGAAVTDAQKAVADARNQLAQDTVAQTNAERDANVAIGDSVGQAAAKYQDLLTQLQVDDQNTAKYAQDLQASREAFIALQAAQAAQTNAVASAAVVPRNTVGVDVVDVANLQRTLAATPVADVTDRANLQAQINQAKVQLATDQLAEANAQEDATVQSGALVAGAKAKLDDADRTLKTEAVGTAAYYQTLLEIRDDKVALAEAEAQSSQLAAAATTNPLDILGEARVVLNGAVAKLAADRRSGASTDTINTDLAAVSDATAQVIKDQVAIANAAQTAAVFPGDPLGTAQANLVNAQRSLAADLVGTQQYYQDLATLKQAQYALAQATVQAQFVQSELGIDLTNPVAVAQAQATEAANALKAAQAAGAPSSVTGPLQVTADQAAANAQKTAFEQQLSDAQINFQLGRTSGAAYLNYLESQHDLLSNIKDKTRQQIDELNDVDQAILAANNQLEGQFNIGNISVPTVFQVRSAVANGGIGSTDNSVTTVTINISGADSGQITQITQALNTNPKAVVQTRKV